MLLKTNKIYTKFDPENFTANVATIPTFEGTCYVLKINGMQASPEYPIPEPTEDMLEMLRARVEEYLLDDEEDDEIDKPEVLELSEVKCIGFPSITNYIAPDRDTDSTIDRYSTALISRIEYYTAGKEIVSFDYFSDKMVLEVSTRSLNGAKMEEYIFYCMEDPSRPNKRLPMPISVVKRFTTDIAGGVYLDNGASVEIKAINHKYLSLMKFVSYNSYESVEKDFYKKYLGGKIPHIYPTLFRDMLIGRVSYI